MSRSRGRMGVTTVELTTENAMCTSAHGPPERSWYRCAPSEYWSSGRNGMRLYTKAERPKVASMEQHPHHGSHGLPFADKAPSTPTHPMNNDPSGPPKVVNTLWLRRSLSLVGT